MTPFQTLTTAILGLSIALAQPASAQDRGASASERDAPSQSRASDEDRDEWRHPGRQHAAAIPVRRVGTHNTTAAGSPISDEELELTCGAAGWIETWLEDANGNPIDGTYEYACLD